MINILIPMAGLGSRFSNAGFVKPKPFIDVLGLPMIERVMENINLSDSRFILIGQKKHFIQEKEIVEQIKFRYPNTEFIGIDKLTEGTVCTLLYAKKYIDNEEPLLIANSDQIVDFTITSFVEDCFLRKLDGSILTFNDTEKNPKWSFVKINSIGLVSEVKEKEAISNDATVGIYLYRFGKDFVTASIQMIIENDRVNNEFYTCPTYNYAIKSGKKIGVYEIPKASMNGIGTPDDLKIYINKTSKKNERAI